MQRKARYVVDLKGRTLADKEGEAPPNSNSAWVIAMVLLACVALTAWWRLSAGTAHAVLLTSDPDDDISATSSAISTTSSAISALAALGTTSFIGAGTSATTAAPSAACDALRQMQVCAHRANVDDQPPGRDLASRFTKLCLARACCFDMDAFATLDGHLLVGRPADADAAVAALGNETRSVTALTLSELQPWGVGLSHGGFPLLVDALQAFRAAATRHGGPQRGLFQTLLMLELKGSAMSDNSISFLAQQAAMMHVSTQLAIWFPDAGHPAESDRLVLALAKINPAVRSIRGFLDRRPASPPAGGAIAGGGAVITPGLRNGDRIYTAFGPSLKLPQAELAAMVTTRKPVVGWTVSTEAELWKAAQLGVKAVITDSPLRMVKGVRDLQQQHCSDKAAGT